MTCTGSKQCNKTRLIRLEIKLYLVHESENNAIYWATNQISSLYILHVIYFQKWPLLSMVYKGRVCKVRQFHERSLSQGLWSLSKDQSSQNTGLSLLWLWLQMFPVGFRRKVGQLRYCNRNLFLNIYLLKILDKKDTQSTLSCKKLKQSVCFVAANQARILYSYICTIFPISSH